MIILAVLMVVVGGVWVFKGTGYLGGSFMTGQSQWTLIGAVTSLIGAIDLVVCGQVFEDYDPASRPEPQPSRPLSASVGLFQGSFRRSIDRGKVTVL